MTAPAPITVAIYARASSDEQTASVPQQLAALRKEAKHRGYQVVREYCDEGLSGSREIEKRVAFHAMIADSYRHEFTRIFCYDSSRFGRIDSQAAGEYKVKLRRNGVQGIDSLGEGFIDWSTQIGRLQDALLSEANYEYSLKLSRTVIRGRVERFQAGVYNHGMVPFGYDKEYEGSGQKMLIPREQKFRMPRGWTRKLVINEKEAEVVRLIYDLYVNKSLSMLAITRELTDRGIPGWYGRPFVWNSVSKILRDKAYIAYAVMHKSRRSRTEVHNRIPAQEVPGVVPVIIEDDQLWHDAQRLHREAGCHNLTHKMDRTLTSILVCGHCGFRLIARQRKLADGSLSEVFYACGRHSKVGTTNACPQWQAKESEVLPPILREFVRVMDEEVMASLTVADEDEPSLTQPLADQVAKLKEKVRTAVMRAATADDDLVGEYEEVAHDLKKELVKAEEKLRLHRLVETDGGPSVWASWWAEIRPGLLLAGDDPELTEEIEAAQKLLPPLKKVKGQGGYKEFSKEARAKLVRVAADGDPDPLKAILPVLLDGETRPGVVTDPATLRGVLRRLGCTVRLFWKPTGQKSQARRYVLDRGAMKVEFKFQDQTSAASPGSRRHAGGTAARCGGSAERTGGPRPARTATAVAPPSAGSA